MHKKRILLIWIAVFYILIFYTFAGDFSNVKDFSLDKTASDTLKFNYDSKWVEIGLEDNKGKITDYSVVYLDLKAVGGFTDKKPTEYKGSVQYGFSLPEKVDKSYVKFVISSSENLQQIDSLRLRYSEGVVDSIFTDFMHYNQYKWKVFDFNDLQEKNPDATISMSNVKGQWIIELTNANDFDPTISDVYTSSYGDGYNDTIYDTQKVGIRLETDALLILDYDDATNPQTRVEDYSLWNNTVWNASNTMGFYNDSVSDCYSGGCWYFDSYRPGAAACYQNVTGQNGLTDSRSMFNFNDSFSVHFCANISVEGGGNTVIGRRQTYGWLVQFTAYTPDLFFDTPTGNSNCQGATQMNDSLWHCYDMVYYGLNSGTVVINRTIFVDGVYDHSCTTPANKDITENYPNDLVIGTYYANIVNITLDNIQVYNKSLTSEEVLYLNNTPQINYNWAKQAGNYTTFGYYGEENVSSWGYLTLNCSVYNNSYIVYNDCAENVTIQVMQSSDNSTWDAPEDTSFNGTDYIFPSNITQQYLMFVTYFSNVTEWLTPVVKGLDLFWMQSTVPDQPILFLPLNATTVTSNPTFQWYNTTDVDLDSLNYSIQIDDDVNFGSINYEAYEVSEEGNGVDFNLTDYKFLTIAEGTYYWRVWASDYNNTIQQNSTNSDPFVFAYSIPVTPVTSISQTTGGGGGGGGGAGGSANGEVGKIFDVDKASFDIILGVNGNQKESFNIIHTGDLSFDVIVSSDLGDHLEIDNKEFTLKPRETKEVGLNFVSGTVLKEITGKIFIDNGEKKFEIPVTLKIIENALYNVLLKLDNKNLLYGNSLKFELGIVPLSESNERVTITYIIKDSQGNQVFIEQEEVDAIKSLRLNKELKPNLNAGEYSLEVNVKSKLSNIKSSAQFNVAKNDWLQGRSISDFGALSLNDKSYVITVGFVLVFFIVFLIILFIKIRQYFRNKKMEKSPLRRRRLYAKL